MSTSTAQFADVYMSKDAEVCHTTSFDSSSPLPVLFLPSLSAFASQDATAAERLPSRFQGCRPA